MDKIREEETGRKENEQTDAAVVVPDCENDSGNDRMMKNREPGFTETATTVLLSIVLTGLAIYAIKNK